MDIKELQNNWDEFGKTDPFWAVLTLPEKKGNKWELDDFYETGVKHVNDVFQYIERLSINVPRKRALDFGCGAGRLTQALAGHFEEVHGIDIAASMIELAKTYNRHGDKCIFTLNESDDLKLFPDNHFNLILSLITLQHIAPRYSMKYIKEFIRVLAPDGLLIFQLPNKMMENSIKAYSHNSLKHSIKNTLPKFLDIFRRDSDNKQPTMEMHGIIREEVVKLVKGEGAIIKDISRIENIKMSWDKNYLYCVAKE